MKKNVPIKSLWLLAAALGCTTTALAQTQELAHWNFNQVYSVADGIGTLTETAISGNGSTELAGVKLRPNTQFMSDGDYSIKTVRPAKSSENAMQSSTAVYWEYKSIKADGAALHMTNPLPNAQSTSATYHWGTNVKNYPDGASASYQTPYNYFEIAMPTTGFKDITMTIKAAGHQSNVQYYAVMTSADGSHWTLIGDEYLTGTSYNNWKTNTIALTGIEKLDQAYIRILPADDWLGNDVNNPYKNNQFDIDDLSISGTIDMPVAEMTALNVTGQTVTAGGSYDFNCNLPKSYNAGTVSFTPTFSNATLTATAINSESGEVSVTDNNGTYSIPTPAANTHTVVTLNLSETAGSFLVKGAYTLYIYHIGDILVSSLSIDGTEMSDLVTALNGDSQAATYSDWTFTTMPVVKAVMIDGSEATVNSTLNGTTATFSIVGNNGEESKTFTLHIEGIHLFTTGASDETVNLIYTSDGKYSNNGWSNGLYTIIGSRLDGNNNQIWKLFNGTTTIDVPADIIVKQITFVNVNDHYNDAAELSAMSSEGATIYIPHYHLFTTQSSYDLVINLDGHKAGQQISFTLINAGQVLPSSIRLVVEKVNPQIAPTLVASSVTDTEHTNHAVVALDFGIEMADGVATCNGQTLKARGGSSKLYFSAWDLDYNTDYTLTAKAGEIKDTYGNATTEDIAIHFTVGTKAAAEKQTYDYVVSDAAELIDAISAVNASNQTATAARKVIFLLDGDYDVAATQLSLSGYNVSLIGQSRDGVLLHGNTTGITNHTITLGNATGAYLQDMTIRNDLNWAMSDKGGVGVALAGGKKAVLKNVCLQSNQDTYVSNDRTYFDGCQIHGTVDFICGGGDIYFDACDIVLENRGGNCITAPSTSASLLWGYVFANCTIKPAEDGTSVTDRSYNLGRPWQNEPRAYYLNTKMEVLPSNTGWTGMSTLPTHFYEYSSTDAAGKAIDLSVRGNSPTSTNTYTPVLTDAEAATFTLHNVLGGTDSWDPTEMTVTATAPKVILSGNTLTWDEDDQVRNYVILKDGIYIGNTTETSIALSGDGTYTIIATNLCGGLGDATSLTVSTTTRVQLTAGNFYTTCLNRAASYTGATIYQVAGVDSRTAPTVLYLEPETATQLEAGRPYIFRANEVSATFYLTGTPTTTATSQNGLCGTLSETALTSDAASYVLWSEPNDWYNVDVAFTLPANRAYLNLNEVPVISTQTAFRMPFNKPTGIHALDIDASGSTVNVYNTAGMIVKRNVTKEEALNGLSEGIYLIDGQKVSIGR